MGGVLKGMGNAVAKNIRGESKGIERVCREWKKKCRNNKTVFIAGSQAECEGRVQIKRRKEHLEVSQPDFAVPFLSLLPLLPRSFARK